MADQKISELNAITGANTADDDLFVIVDTSTNETKKIAKSELVSTINAALVDGAPTTLDTLNELAAALNDDANFATTVTNSLAGKVDTSGDSMTGNLSFGDNDKAIFGAGSDLQIYHDGNNSLINDTGTGDLRLRTNNKVVIEGSSGEDHAVFNDNGAVQLYFDSGTYPAAKLATTSTGIDVTGTATMDGLTVDGTGGVDIQNGYLKLGVENVYNGVIHAPESLWINVDSNNDDTTEVFTIGHNTENTASAKMLSIGESGDISFYEDTGTTAKFFWDASAEGLGIGTSSPSSFNSEANNLVVGDGAGNNGITIYGQSNAYSQIYFADGTTNPAPYAGYIRYDHGVNAMRFATNDGSERMRIDSSGNLLVGTTSQAPASLNGTGAHIYLSGQAQFSQSGTTALELNRKTSDGNIATFRKDGTTVGSIGSYGGVVPYFARPSVGGIAIGGNPQIFPCNEGGSGTNGAMDLGASNNRFKDLYLSGGVYLGGTGSANYLDDYESGTWTPTNVSNFGTLSNITAEYTKIGNMVHITCYFVYSGATSSGSATLGGLPFAVDNPHPLTGIDCIVSGWGPAKFFLGAAGASSTLTIETGQALEGTWSTSSNFRISGWYQTSA